MDKPTAPEQLFTFSWIDYSVFIAILSISLLIGIYFGFCANQKSTTDYLLGGKKMKSLPVAISLAASQVSGITVLAIPADVYKFGSNYIWINFNVILTCLISVYVFFPVFFKLQFTSIFEYLSVRFDKKIQIIASVLFLLMALIYNSIVIYVPALAFSQATGISIHYLASFITVICIFYTAIGGLKAVVWTDTLQFFGIIGSAVTIMIMGVAEVGGLENVYRRNIEGHRLDLLNFEFDPTIRDGFWAYLIGGTIYCMSLFTTNQGTIQKMLSVPSLSHAKHATVIFCVLFILLTSISVFTGNLLYAKYSTCDPLLSNKITKTDQIFPYFVMEIGGSFPGLPGIFIGGVFSAALSSLSASLNTVAGVIYQDFLLPFLPLNTSQRKASNILKILVVVVGSLCICLVYIIEHMGGILQLTATLQGIIVGPLLGLFTLGVLFPMANSKGALFGVIGSLAITSWIVANNQWNSVNGLLPNLAKPISIDGCNFDANLTATLTSINQTTKPLPFLLYRLSFWYNSFIGASLVVILGVTISWITKKSDHSVHPDLLSPVIYSMLSKQDQKMTSVDQTIELVTNSKTKEVKLTPD